jgi:hypothetical protein
LICFCLDYLFHMEDIRKMVRQILKESTLFEAAKTFMDIPPNSGIVVQRVSSNLIDISLFDFREKKCIGNISLVKVSDRAYAVNTAGADNSFGPLMYEIAMMHVFPSHLCSDRSGNTTFQALNIWKKFYDLRGDVQKYNLKPGEPEFREKFQREDENYILNCLYSRRPSTWFLKTIERGLELKKKTKIQDDKIFDICSNFFQDKYATR